MGTAKFERALRPAWIGEKRARMFEQIKAAEAAFICEFAPAPIQAGCKVCPGVARGRSDIEQCPYQPAAPA
ncbi:hypothetical protein CR159_20545 [Pollutimonas subterranea]|uniref:Uncharacterized protein n=1 Tax=Pollutimonas subterranea TaxID=2045210 RepID=A0A2N4TYZ1_9BURK|nr:hypothetical protein CR159_20545 [Pollutimonas subterranea]